MTDLGNQNNGRNEKNNENKKIKINQCPARELDLEYLQMEYLDIQEDKEHGYQPFAIKDLQNYIPIYNRFFELNETNFNSINLNHPYYFVNMDTIESLDGIERIKQNVFIKYSPLIDPVRYMIGKYKNNSEKVVLLPSFKNGAESLSKMTDHNNSSYVDAFFSYLSSQLLHKHGFVHGIDFYGSYLGIQETFKANITDDLEYLHNSTYFNKNVGSLYTITKPQASEFLQFGSRNNKQKLQISSLSNTHNLSIISIVDEDPEKIPTMNVTNDNDNSELVYNKSSKNNSVSTSISSSSSSKSDLNYTSDEEEEEEEDEDEDQEEEDEDEDSADTESTEEEEIFSYIKNFPMQMICLEKCHGTIDELFETGIISEVECGSAMFQIVMTLITYQKAFQFTHNDLHTNNIMYINTDIDYLYYCFQGKYYKVPTYGRIYKIIDFGRSIYKFDGQLFCSDSFAPGGDAVTQYNFEPYMDENKPRLEPNMSFDLCRLGCSIFDFIMEVDDDPQEFDDFQNTVYRWCMDDNEKNVLYKKNGEERYPSFKLYKMIARTVHKHSPEEQLKIPLFTQFEMTSKQQKKDFKKTNMTFMNIDEIPAYII
jgi:hypothetical protein